MIVNVYVDDRFHSLMDVHIAPQGIVSHPGPMAVVCGVYFPVADFDSPAVHPTVRMSSRMAQLVGLPDAKVVQRGA